MTNREYEKRIGEFDKSPGTHWYYGLGLAGEAGELANKIKKVYRDDGGVVIDSVAMLDELGDCLWYVTRYATRLGYSLSNVMVRNITKLSDRKERGTLKGNGDNR